MVGGTPIPVRACAFCYEVHHKDADGFESLELEAWFCHVPCYYQALLTSGNLSMKTNQGLVKEVIRMRQKHYQPEYIQDRRNKLLSNIHSGKYKIIRKTYGEPSENEKVR